MSAIGNNLGIGEKTISQSTLNECAKEQEPWNVGNQISDGVIIRNAGAINKPLYFTIGIRIIRARAKLEEICTEYKKV